jgi:hypothetical protein
VTITVETFADKVAMCEALYTMGTLVAKIKRLIVRLFGVQEGSEVLEYWKKYRLRLI